MKKALFQGLGLLIGTAMVVANLLTQRKVEANVAFAENSQPTAVSASPTAKPTSADHSFLIAQASSLNGVWNCNDGGVYFVRQVGNEVWWYGQSSDGGATWSNVFHGVMRGNQIDGRWADVPKGSIRGYGEMTLAVLNAGRIEKVMGGQNFGGSSWSR